jgi:hypothetical protein
MQIISFIEQTKDFSDKEETAGKSSCTHVSFPWEDLIRTLRMDIKPEWIEVGSWGISFCKRIEPDDVA